MRGLSRILPTKRPRWAKIEGRLGGARRKALAHELNGRNVIRMNTNQEPDDATRVACILGVSLAESVVRQWSPIGEIVAYGPG